MTLVATSFLILAQNLSSSRLGMELPDGILDCSVAVAAFEVVDGLFNERLVIRDNPDGMNRC